MGFNAFGLGFGECASKRVEGSKDQADDGAYIVTFRVKGQRFWGLRFRA